MDLIALDGLRAAQAAAGHAWASAVAGWVAIAVNAVGLVFIWAQLRSNREAVRAAAKGADAAAVAARIALMSERPWIQHFIDQNLKIEVRDGALEIDLKWRWTNVGNTPAVRVVHLFKLVRDDDVSLYDACEMASLLASPAPILFPNQSDESSEPVLLGVNDETANAGWRFRLILAYSIPGDPERRITAGDYRLKKGRPADSGGRMYPNMAINWEADIQPVILSHAINT